MLFLQIFTILFSIALAWVNKIPCRKMIDFGASLSEEREFHRANAVIKIVFAAIVSKGVVLPFIAIMLIQWIVFDVALNVFLKKDNILYVGETAKTDKLLRKYLGGDVAGLWKVIIVTSLILIVNFFM